MGQKVVCYKLSAPKKSDCITAKDFCENTLIPTYMKYREDNPASVKVKLDITVDKTTEQSLYFVQVNKILKNTHPEIISSYTISRRK